MRFASLLFFLPSIVTLCGAQDTDFSKGPEYLMNHSSPLFLRPIATPALSLDTPALATPNAPAEEHSGTPDTRAFGELRTQGQIDWIYWGVGDLTFNQLPPECPATPACRSETTPAQPAQTPYFDVGVTAIATPGFLREGGYGTPLGDIATYWKHHPLHAARVYTNADIARLNRGQVSP